MEVTNRFKGLDLINRLSEQLWMEVCNIAQKAVIKTIPKKNKGKMVIYGRREGKGRGEKERYTHLNAEFQRKHGEIR